MSREDTLVNAIVGAVVMIVLSFLPFSPALGGGVAGYLQRSTPIEGARVGAIAGAIAFVPFLAIVVLALGFVSVGLSTVDAFAGVAVAIVGLFMLVFVVLYSIGLSAVGGYVGAYLAAEYEPERLPEDRLEHR